MLTKKQVTMFPSYTYWFLYEVHCFTFECGRPSKWNINIRWPWQIYVRLQLWPWFFWSFSWKIIQYEWRMKGSRFHNDMGKTNFMEYFAVHMHIFFRLYLHNLSKTSDFPQNYHEMNKEEFLLLFFPKKLKHIHHLWLFTYYFS